MSGHDDRSVLSEAKRGDDLTVQALKSAVEGPLPASVRDLVEHGYAGVCASHVRLEELQQAAP